MFDKVENGVTKSCQIFRRKNRKNAIYCDRSGFVSSQSGRIACMVRESRDRSKQNI